MFFRVFEKIVEVVMSAPQVVEQLVEVFADNAVEVSVLQEIVEVVRLALQERVQKRTDEQVVEVPVPQRLVEQSMAERSLRGSVKRPERLSPREAGWRRNLRTSTIG